MGRRTGVRRTASRDPSLSARLEEEMVYLTYEELCDFEVLYKAYLEARKRKRSKASTAQYEANALACTDKLSRILLLGVYRPGKFEIFIVYEPKKRMVQAPAFVDKVVLHAITDNVLYDAITHSFIRDNYASQKQKGTHDGLLRLKEAMGDYYRKNGSAEGWVLKGDVRHFFASIDHDLLKAKLQALVKRRGIDPKIYDLLCIYIDTTEGLPLGYQTSQLFALLFLDEFDHWIKERCGVRYYGRYMDDFYIIARTKKELQTLLAAITVYMEGEGLELNEKTGIFPLRNGIDFLGFHTYLTETGGTVQKLRRDSIQRMKGRIKTWREEYPAGEISKDKIIEQWTSWDAHAAHGDTHALREKIAGQVGAIIGEKLTPRRKITSSERVKALRKAKAARQQAKKQGGAGATPFGTFSPVPRPDTILPLE